ncbi:MAG: response regulator [Deltaproteobacteria bacterium]|nr:response regulator [Deltaproteobacteria bacterium]
MALGSRRKLSTVDSAIQFDPPVALWFYSHVPRKFLVIDDDAGVRGLLKRFLESKGCHVAEAADGIEAITRFQEVRPDVVLLDILLPRAIGFEVCRKIKALSEGAKTPVLMMSAVCKTTLEELQKNFQCPADGFLAKPFQLQSLLPYLGEGVTQAATPEDANLVAGARASAVPPAAADTASDKTLVEAGSPPVVSSHEPESLTVAQSAGAATKPRPTLLRARVVAQPAPPPSLQDRVSTPAPKPGRAVAERRTDVIVASADLDHLDEQAEESTESDETTRLHENKPAIPDALEGGAGAPREPSEWMARLARTYLEQVIGRATSDLSVSRGEYHRVVSFSGGQPVDVMSHFRHENLGTFMMLRGDITEAEYNDCLEHMISHGCSVDESTVHLGLLAPAQVVSLTLSYKIDLFASAFAWKSGDVAVQPSSSPSHVGASRVRIDAIGAALEGIGRVYGDSVLRSELERARGKFLVRVRGGDRVIEKVQPVFVESLWRALWDGRTAVHALADILGPKGVECRRAVKLLEVVGAIQLGERGREPEIGTDETSADNDEEVTWGAGTHSFGRVGVAAERGAAAPIDDVPDAATEDEVWSESLRMARLNHFDVLGVEREADPLALSRAFRRLLLKFDPLRMEALRNESAREKAWEILERGAAAFGAVADAEFRAIYDRRVDRSGSQPLAVPQIDPEVQFARGKNLIALEDFAGAGEAFRRALEVRPDFAEAHLFLGLAMYQADPRESVAREAIDHMKSAIELDPKNDMAYYYLGQVYRRLGIADKARTMFQRAVELNLSNVLANRELKPGR